MFKNEKHQIYSDLIDMTQERFELVVKNTLIRRKLIKKYKITDHALCIKMWQRHKNIEIAKLLKDEKKDTK